MFASFFKSPKISENECLLFTTFVLDEAVLVSLLNKYDTNKYQQIVVYHDILRHRNPGFLVDHYPNAIVYSVILQSAIKKNCPIFHTKLWARIKNNKFIKIAILSANLSAYHLVKTGEGSGTFESFIEIECAGKNLPNSYIFSNLKQHKKQHEKLNVKPETILVDTRKGFYTELSDKKIFEIIQNIDEVPIMCAAPFLNGNAISSILINKNDQHFTAYTGRSCKTGLSLHAKLFLFEKTVILGSANLTSQALGIAGKTVNHELVLLKKSNKDKFAEFKKFEKADFNKFKNDNPGDNDPEDNLPTKAEDWIKERLSRINAPDDAILRIINDKAFIELVGNCKTGNILISSKRINKVVTLSINNNILTPNKTDSHIFAEIISKGNVEIRCIKYGKIVWRVELNYGEFWQALELRSHFNIISGEYDVANRLKSKQQIAQYDVRDMRQLAIADPEKGRKFAPFVRWLSNEGISVAHIPEWCQKLAHKIQQGKA